MIKTLNPCRNFLGMYSPLQSGLRGHNFSQHILNAHAALVREAGPNSIRHSPETFMYREAGRQLQKFPSPSILPSPAYQSHPRSAANHLLQPLPPLNAEGKVEHTAPLLPVDPLTTSYLASQLTVFLTVTFLYLETHTTWKPQYPHLLIPQIFPPGITQTQILLRIKEGYRNQGTRPPPNKYKSRYQHLLLQYPQTQILRQQHKNTINNRQDDMYLLKLSNFTTAGSEY